MKKTALGIAFLLCAASLMNAGLVSAQAEDHRAQDAQSATEVPLNPDSKDASDKDLSIESTEDEVPAEETPSSEVIPELIRRFLGQYAAPDQQPEAFWQETLGFEQRDVFERLKSYAHDDVLDSLLTYYGQYKRISLTSRGYSGDDFFSNLHRIDHLTFEQKSAIIQTLLPLLTRNAIRAGDLTGARKYRMMWRSYERLWPERHVAIQCDREDSAVRFDLLSLETGRLNGKQTVPGYGSCKDDNVEHGECLSVTAMSPVCYAQIVSGTFEAFSERFEGAMLEALAALSVKDNALTTDTLGELNDLLEELSHRYKFNASWNRHWDGAGWQQWLGSLHILTLMMLEQHRFAELSRMERNIQSAFHGATFYMRTEQLDAYLSKTSPEFQRAYERLQHSSYYAWVRQHFSPKGVKKLEKDFSSWTKKGRADVILPRRLTAAWALWSDGDYARAARFAGDVSAKKSRIVHPQLHSFALMLKAAAGEPLEREDLETYVRVIYLKSPWLAYQTLTECSYFLNARDRALVADVMRAYSPGDASADAARFYRAFEPELRAGMTASHRSRIDAWLETELRRTESEHSAHKRRVRWLSDLLDTEDAEGIDMLCTLSLKDFKDAKLIAFWQAVQCHNAESGESCPNDVISSSCEAESARGVEWLRKAAACETAE